MRVCGILAALCLLVYQCHGKSTVFKFDQSEWNSVKKDTKDNQENKGQTGQCGYKGCDLGRSDRLNVHLVAHTHDDVGWLKTVDQYYYGAHSEIQEASVQYILDTVVTELLADERRRFIYVEIAFFYRWWREQDAERQEQVRMLVNEGRLEFILGGWCMNDEAATHYNAMIDQHTLGFRFLSDTFGECATPHIGWQIDPFGHSREQASMFAQFGFDGYFFGRLDYQDKDKRLNDKTMESMWMASSNLGDASSLFTGVNYNGYGPPDGFCFQCDGNQPIMDDKRLEDYNVEDRVKEFVKAAKEQARNFTTNHIMMTMGSDFQYENAIKNFKNLDKLIKYVNELEGESSKINVLYSTPGCYLYALNQANQTYTQKTDDFFPYASRAHTFWTGYFTSRPALKGYVRQCNNFLQTCKQMDALGKIEPDFNAAEKVEMFKHAMGVAQHHDAVSGTEKQPVAYDYARRLAEGETSCQEVVNHALGKLLGEKSGTSYVPQQHFCRFNVSSCDVSEQNAQFSVVVYNPLGRPVSEWLRIPVVSGSVYTVLDDSMAPVPSQIVPLSDQTRALPEHKGSKADAELVFAASQIPGLGFRTFFVQKALEEPSEEVPEGFEDEDIITIGNEKLTLTFDASTGLLKTMENKKSGISLPLQQSLKWYKAFTGNNSKDIFQASGAYIFRPDGTSPRDLPASIVKVTKGSEVEEVEQKFGDFASQVVRLYKGAAYAEIEWTVGPIPYKDNVGKEIISRFESDLMSEGLFFTDSNGREILERKRDYRPTWNLNQTEKVAGNYYPVNSRIYIKDEGKKAQLTVLTDRSQGGASIVDGSVELMVHRRLFVDDAFGVGEALNETGINGDGLIVRGKHYVILESIDASAALHRSMGEQLFMAPTVTVAPLYQSPQQYASHYTTKYTRLSRWLPDNVHLLTLERWGPQSVLLRLEHFYEKGEDATLSQPATVSLKDLFKDLNVISATELTLGANQRLDSAKRLRWNVQNHGTTNGDMSSFVKPLDADFNVELQPMQIRTFEVTVSEE